MKKLDYNTCLKEFLDNYETTMDLKADLLNEIDGQIEYISECDKEFFTEGYNAYKSGEIPYDEFIDIYFSSSSIESVIEGLEYGEIMYFPNIDDYFNEYVLDKMSGKELYYGYKDKTRDEIIIDYNYYYGYNVYINDEKDTIIVTAF